MQLVKLVPSMVRLGEPLPWDIRDDQGKLLLSRAHVINDATHLQTLLERGAYVNAEEAKAYAMAMAKAAAAKRALQGKLAVQGVPPTPGQSAILAEHPTKGADMLRAAGVTDEAWLQAVAQHHERTDGSGYPAKISEPSELAQALRHVDVFMA